MKLIIAGSRDLNVSSEFIESCLVKFNLDPTEIISGGARGVDTCGHKFAKEGGMFFTLFEADWRKNGKMAGPMRNSSMARYGDELLLIWDGKSKGSANMKARMVGLKKPVHEVILKGTP